jgi:raffinose/stachyose/melibiose transport system substrate-binding protein
MKIARLRFVTAGVAVATVMTMTACGMGSDSGSSGSGDGSGKTTLTLLIDNADATVKGAASVVAAFQAANPNITVKTETRPGGSEGDNLVKTRLSTGDMSDVFWYNSGSLLQALHPAQSLVDLTNDAALKDVEPAFLPVVTQDGKVYGGPVGTAMGGGVLYNKSVYSKLGLQVPKTWAEFLANNDKIKAAGTTAVISTFKDTWTSQLFVLGDFHNVAKADPSFANDYTANKKKYATSPAALRGFEKLAEVNAKGYLNKGYGSSTLEQGLKLLGDGTGAHYPMLTFAVGQMPADQAKTVGFFGIPGDDAANNGATLWMPAGAYIPKTSKHIDAAKKLVAFIASVAGTEAYTKGVPPTGPYLVKGSKLPADALPVVKDLQAYIDAKAETPALEFLSPVKGPSLEQITVAVGSGQTAPKAGAAQYDQDVTKEAKQLGLPGW